jgi:hypothetical protein
MLKPMINSKFYVYLRFKDLVWGKRLLLIFKAKFWDQLLRVWIKAKVKQECI